MKRCAVLLTVLPACASPLPAPTAAHEHAPKFEAPQPTLADQVAGKLASGELAHGLSEPGELETLLGTPVAKKQERDGGHIVLRATYEQAEVVFSRRANTDTPFVLRHIVVQGRELPEPAMLVLRSPGDLTKLDPFRGFEHVALERLDLRDKAKLLWSYNFDTATVWPAAARLPADFRPGRLLEEGRDPGLGVRALHAEGIDGRGVHIAIIDQPLLRNHREYRDRVVAYTSYHVAGFPPQMHGSPVVSIAAGSSLGVAPRASVHYFAIPMWKDDNRPYVWAIDGILAHNHAAKPAERIRVASISNGRFPHMPHYDAYQDALARAERAGVLVITCEGMPLSYLALRRSLGKSIDDAASYVRARWVKSEARAELWVPTEYRTIASHRGSDVYAFEMDGGLSWAAPYLAGTAALAIQVAPNLTPEEIRKLLVDTATKTDVGRVVSPRAIIDEARER